MQIRDVLQIPIVLPRIHSRKKSTTQRKSVNQLNSQESSNHSSACAIDDSIIAGKTKGSTSIDSRPGNTPEHLSDLMQITEGLATSQLRKSCDTLDKEPIRLILMLLKPHNLDELHLRDLAPKVPLSKKEKFREQASQLLSAHSG